MRSIEMKNCSFYNKTRKLKLTAENLLPLIAIMTFWATPAHSQGMGMKMHSSPEAKQTLTDQISEIRSKVFKLETALEKKHREESVGNAAGSGRMGMQGMGPMGRMKPGGMQGGPMRNMKKMPPGPMSSGPKMNGKGMMGMQMMGRMKQNARLPSSLPGFPGVSHIYHIGSTDFFLDHSDHIDLTLKQKTTLNQIKEQTSLDNSTMDRNVQKLEQDLWVLTSSDQPDIKKIAEKVGEIERLKGKMRLDFIQAVGKAAGVLSSEQLELLKGMAQDSPQ
jgi:hypothetical protein